MKKSFIIILFTLLFPINVFAGRGCCSYHGGQNYCGDDGYWICRDGSRSKTCTCNSIKIDTNNYEDEYEKYDNDDYDEENVSKPEENINEFDYKDIIFYGLCGIIGYAIAKHK